MSSKDMFGDRMKSYEKLMQQRFMPRLPIIARLDGKSFSRWTRSFAKPYDLKMSHSMINTTKRLVEETHACIGYTQSDEITLIYYSDNEKSQVFFDGKISKMISVLASMCTAFFNEEIANQCKELHDPRPKNPALFDCRVFQVPTKTEASNCILWREKDATKNSVSMLTRFYFSPLEMHGKSVSDMHEMLHSKLVNWNNYPQFFKRGTFIQKRVVDRAFSENEIKKLPEKHQARTNPNLKIKRTDYIIIDMPPFSKVLNKNDVIFSGKDPIVEVAGGDK